VNAQAQEAFANFDGTLKLQGSHALVDEVGDKLKAMLDAAGIDQGHWQLPVFMCESLQGPNILPVFLNPREIPAVWEKAGRKAEDLPDKFVMMDIRMLVAEMRKPDMPWDKVHFVGTKESAEFANELQGLERAA
jgi:hypothetical protein